MRVFYIFTHFLNASGFMNEAQSVCVWSNSRVAQSVCPNSVQEITWQ